MITVQKPLQASQSVEKRNFIFCIVAFLLCLRHILQILGFSSIASTIFKVLYVLVFVFLAIAILQKIQIRQTLGSFLFFLIFLLFYAWLVVNLFFLYRQYLEPSITFLLALPLLFCNRAVTLSKKDALVFFYCLSAVATLLVIFAFIPSAYKNGMLMLYTSNENQSGLLYMSIFLGIYTFLFIAKRKNVFLWALALGLLYGAFKTGSRASFTACVLCNVLSVLLFLLPRWKKAVLIVFMTLFLILPFAVTLLVEQLGVDFEFMGSSAWTGREEIWPHVIETVSEDPFSMRLGQSVAHNYSTELGAHNALLDVAWKFSLPIAVIFFIGLFAMGRLLHKVNAENRCSGVLLSCFAAGLLHMAMEASLITGALDYTLYFLLAMFCGIPLLREGKEK